MMFQLASTTLDKEILPQPESSTFIEKLIRVPLKLEKPKNLFSYSTLDSVNCVRVVWKRLYTSSSLPHSKNKRPT